MSSRLGGAQGELGRTGSRGLLEMESWKGLPEPSDVSGEGLDCASLPCLGLRMPVRPALEAHPTFRSREGGGRGEHLHKETPRGRNYHVTNLLKF